jgi:opacity protein-like surface antigen
MKDGGTTYTRKADYVNVPIMANVYVAPGLAVKLGVQPGFNVNSKFETTVAGTTGSTDIDAKSVDFSIPVGLSYEYKNVVLDARYNWGLTKVFDNRDYKNSVFQITLGYKFDL